MLFCRSREGVRVELALRLPDFDNDSPNSLMRVRDPFN